MKIFLMNTIKVLKLSESRSEIRVSNCLNPGSEVIKLFSSSTQMSTKFILLINIKMPTIVSILTFISMINTTSERQKSKILLNLSVFKVL